MIKERRKRRMTRRGKGEGGEEKNDKEEEEHKKDFFPRPIFFFHREFISPRFFKINIGNRNMELFAYYFSWHR